jgi:DNA modification methylase
MCGDATLQEDMGRLMMGKKAAVVVTDPPYGVFYDNTVHFTLNPITGKEDHHDKDWGKVEGDQSVEVALKALPIIFQNIQENGSVYICSGTKLAVAIVNWLDANKIKYSPFLVWVKPHFVVTWQRYHNKHELIVYCGPGSGPTHGSRWFGPNNEPTVWEILRR